MSDDTSPADDLDELLDDEGAMALIETLRAENAALKDQALRYAAEADNTKRRAEREANDARAYAIQKFARDLLGAADNISRALATAPAEGADTAAVKNFVLGVQMIDKDLQGAFERNGLKRVDPVKGAKFDPHQHQAMMEQESTEVAAGAVIQVLAPGYELFGRLVRPAMVVVAAKGSTGEAAVETAAQNPYADGGDGDSGASVDTRA
jgi:molecular chaperone GrpE